MAATTFTTACFKFSYSNGPILSSDESEQWKSKLNIHSLPDIVFPSNHLTISFKLNSTEFNLQNETWIELLKFDAFSAISLVNFTSNPQYFSCKNEHGRHDQVELPVANNWRSSRNPENIKPVLAPYDWTWSSNYSGSLSTNCEVYHIKTIEESEENCIFDKNLLKSTIDPILFSTSLDLYEDEMADHGISTYSIRLRVMPSYFLLLCRSYVHVENSLLRSIETRYMGYTHKTTASKDLAILQIQYVKELRLSVEQPATTALNISPSEWQLVRSDSDKVASLLPMLSSTHKVIYLPSA